MASQSSGNGIKGLFVQNSKLKPGALIVAIALFVVGAWAIRQYVDIDATGSSANCYGYNCPQQPSVSIAGRLANSPSSPVSYGTLVVPYGSFIELTWYGLNVDRCEATGRWTKFKEAYMPLTLYSKPITSNQDFEVVCRKGRQTTRATLNVILEGKQSSDTKDIK